MRSSELNSRREYWIQVRECLVRFHGYGQKQADDEVARLIHRLPINSTSSSVDFVYHVEPFRLACKVTGKRLKVSDFAAEYDKLLDETAFWSKSGINAPKTHKYLLTVLNSYLEKKLKPDGLLKRVRESRQEYSATGDKQNKKELKTVAAARKKKALVPRKKTISKKADKPIR